MSSIKLRWTIEYWNDTLKKVECFSNEDGTWEESPKDNVNSMYTYKDSEKDRMLEKTNFILKL